MSPLPESPTLSAWRSATDAAYRHADTCRQCFSPIVADAEGNPGYRSEACAVGAVILQTWQEAERALTPGDIQSICEEPTS